MENNLFKSGVLLFALGSMSCISLWAQGTVEDYNRAYALREKYNAKHVLYAGVVPHWVDQTSAFWYVRQTEKGKEYVKVDAASKKRTALFDQQKMASALTEKAGREINAYNLPLQNCRLNISLDTLRFQLDGKFWAYSIKNNRLLDEGAIPSRGKERHWMEVDDEKEGSPVTSPDGKWTAFIKNDNVYVREVATGKEKQLSQDGTLSNYYSSYIQWSPDSKSVVSCRIRPVEKRYVYYVESSPADQAQPKLHKQEYAKPGDELRFKVPCIFEVESGRRLIPSTELFSHQYELSGPMWNADSKAITFEYNERGHKVYRVLEMSAVDGSVRTLIEEKEEKYVNYPRIYRNYLSDGKRIIWSSERDNYNHLYLYDRATGKPLNQITKGEWYVRGVQHVDEANEVIYFSANGMKKGEDPYLIHYYKINFDGSNLVELTPEEGMHQCWYSSDYKYLVDVYSKVDQAPIAVLRDAKNGKIRMQLDKADISALLANGWKAPEVFSAKGRDGKTDMWGVIYRPSNFDPSKKYPVIIDVYGEPAGSTVQDVWQGGDLWHQYLANQGYIVVSIENRGAAAPRGREWRKCIYGEVGTFASQDQAQGILDLARQYSFIDTSRIGITGWSGGGSQTLNCMFRYPDVFCTGIAIAFVSDQRLYDTIYQERYMNTPQANPEGYRKGSPITYVEGLKGNLLLIHGTGDDNVHYQSCEMLVNELVKHGKVFYQLSYPMRSHSISEREGTTYHLRKSMTDYFLKNLPAGGR